MTLLIDKDTVDLRSNTFSVPKGGQITVVAAGLSGNDVVEFEIVRITPAKTPSCLCPPSTVIMPSVVWSAPLECCGTRITLTESNPYVVIDYPQVVMLRAILLTDDVELSEKVVWYEETFTHNANDRMRGCPCN